MNYLNKKNGALVEVVSNENGVIIINDKGVEKKIKEGLFNRIYKEATDEEIASFNSKKTEKTLLAEKKKEERKIVMNAAREAKGKAKIEDAEHIKKICENAPITSEFVLNERGNLTHTMVVESNGVKLVYVSTVKNDFKGISATKIIVDDVKRPEYNNIGVATIAQDFAAELGLVAADIETFMKYARRSSIHANKENFSGADLTNAKAEWKNRQAVAKQSKTASKLQKDQKDAVALATGKAVEKEEVNVELVEKGSGAK